MKLSIEEIQTVLINQQNEIQRITQGAVPRMSLPEARALWRRPGALVVTGIRRCGKSTFCHQLLSDQPYGYINFDDERLTGLNANDLQRVLEALHSIHPSAGELRVLLLDEIQNIERWELFVNRLLRQGYQLAITGSNSRLLSKELATHLTGRARAFELAPFSYAESLLTQHAGVAETKVKQDTQTQAKLQTSFNKYLKEGGFPEQLREGYLAQDVRELFDRIVTRDIAMRRKIRNPSILKEIALFAVSLFGKRMTFQSVAKTVGLNGINTAKNYLSYLEESYLISTVLPYSEKIKEQIRLPRKIYVMDNAIATSLSTRSTEDSGPLLECIVYQELRRRKAEIWTYLSPKVEVDFLIRQGRKVTQLVQSCWSLNNSNTQTREIHALCEAAKSTGCRDLLIITRDEKQTLIQNGYRIQVIPVIEWLLAGSDQYNS